MSLTGCDVSHWNGAIDWSTAAAGGVQFAIASCTESTTYADPTFPGTWAAMKAAGVARGAYHFAQPDLSSAADEAAHFLDHVGPLLEPGDVLALDLEAGTGDLGSWALAWLQTVEQTCGFAPLLYSSPAFLAEHNITDPAFARCGLWLASWGPRPSAPAPWSFWAIWQDSDRGNVAGFAAPVDTDVFNGSSVDQLRAYGKPQPVVPPFGDAERLALCRYAAGGSSPTDLAAWIATYKGA